jgi:hypothetical protein
MNKTRREHIEILLASVIIILIGLQLSQPAIGASDVENPLIIDSLEKRSVTWEITRSMGTFAQNDIHPHNSIKYHVFSVDGVNKIYHVNVSTAPWSTREYGIPSSAVATGTTTEYKVIKRDWKSAMSNIFAVSDASYWGYTATQLRTMYSIDYSDEFIWGQLINVVTISFSINSTNYDIIRYTRSEGILISRSVSIDTNDGEVMGKYEISLTSYDGIFTVSFWNYVIWFSVIFVGVFIIISVLSVFISKRQQSLKNLNY